MRRHTPLVIITLVCTLTLLSIEVCVANQIENEALEGIWLGTLKVPGAELRIAIIIVRTTDGTLSAVMRSIDQGGGEIPIDEFTVEEDTIKLKLNRLGVEIEGIVDLVHDTIESEFRQRGGMFPLLLKRVDSLPKLNRPQEPTKPYPYYVQGRIL